MALTHVVVYDISDDHRRARVAAILQAYGDRIQHSMFVWVLEPDLLSEILARVADIINPGTDPAYIFRQCAACWDAVGVHGQATADSEPLYWAVL
jgi:CRISPR-associated protein Cas2